MRNTVQWLYDGENAGGYELNENSNMQFIMDDLFSFANGMRKNNCYEHIYVRKYWSS